MMRSPPYGSAHDLFGHSPAAPPQANEPSSPRRDMIGMMSALPL
jgi:hypothetical protein